MPDQGERHLKPTARRIQKAREKGQVPRSRELGPAFAFLAVAMVASFAGSAPWIEPFRVYPRALQEAARADFDLATGARLIETVALSWLPALAVLLGSAFAGSLIAELLQGGPHPSADPIKLDPSKMSPVAKLKSLFSFKHVWEGGRALFAGGIAIWIFAWALRDLGPELPGLLLLDSKALGARMGEILIGIASRAGLGLAVVAGIDLLMNHYLYVRQLRMSREELRQEMRESEGRPEIKSARRRRMIELVRARAVGSVARADVVVTNPTHYAVALQYRRGLMRAPKVVAKGRNRTANRIRLEAVKHGVPIVENPALARELYRKVEIDGEVPPDLYLAVAEVIAFVMRLNASLNSGEAPAMSAEAR